MTADGVRLNSIFICKVFHLAVPQRCVAYPGKHKELSIQNSKEMIGRTSPLKFVGSN